MDSPALSARMLRGWPAATTARSSPGRPRRRDIDQIRGLVLSGRRFPDRLRGGLARRRRIPGHLTRTATR